MDYLDFGKLIPIVLAGVFAIVGILWEIKDKSTGRITRWGKTFAVLTIISTVSAIVTYVYSAQEAQRKTTQAQNDTLQLLSRTEQSIVHLQRLLQPLDKPTIALTFSLDCNHQSVVRFCTRTKEQALRDRTRLYSTDIVAVAPEWALWPPDKGATVRGPTDDINLFFFKTSESFNTWLTGCDDCSHLVDLSTSVPFNTKLIEVRVNLKTQEITFHSTGETKQLMMPTAQLLSMPDFSGSTVLLFGCSGFLCLGADHLQALTPIRLEITTPRGQSVTTTSNFKAGEFPRSGLDLKRPRVFSSTFPPK